MATLQQFSSSHPRLFYHHTIDLDPNDSAFQMHVHDGYEVFLLLSGHVEYCVETAVYPLKPGCVIITRPMESHCVHILDSTPYERCCLNFNAEALSAVDTGGRLLIPFHNRPLGQNCFFSPRETESLSPASLFAAITRETANEACTPGQVLTYLYPLLSELLVAFEKRSDVTHMEPHTSEEMLVDYVNRHLYEDLSVEQVCENFYLSPSQVSRLFKRTTGSSLWNYVLVKRLTEARRLIREGAFARQAAEQVGFHDYSVFYRAYRKRYGTSPQKDDGRIP